VQATENPFSTEQQLDTAYRSWYRSSGNIEKDSCRIINLLLFQMTLNVDKFYRN
jgi:hypothetical protein